jgi:Zn ribbon nucleic-acid-binding protein
MIDDEPFWPMRTSPEGWEPCECPRCLSINWQYDANVQMFECLDCGHEGKENPEQSRE